MGGLRWRTGAGGRMVLGILHPDVPGGINAEGSWGGNMESGVKQTRVQNDILRRDFCGDLAMGDPG